MTIDQPTSFAEATDLSGRSVRATNFLLDHWWAWLVFGFVLWLALRIRSQHALLAQLDERCEAAFGDVDALLVERHGLIDNLVEAVKGFAGQEHRVLKDVIEARSRASSGMGRARLEAETQIGQSVNGLLAISEHYPELASSAHFAELRSELVRMEDRISAARRFYNLAVEELNSVRRAFPGMLIDAVSKVGRHEKFGLGERRSEIAEPVKISLQLS